MWFLQLNKMENIIFLVFFNNLQQDILSKALSKLGIWILRIGLNKILNIKNGERFFKL